MPFYSRDKPRFSDRLRGSTDDDFMDAFGRHLDQESKLFFDTPATTRTWRERDPFDRPVGFSRGFPFDDDDFESRGNIRSHLDHLAARHPEFADHLLGPPWGDAPLLGNRRNQRRGSGLSNSQSHPDEDARSQASGSSAASAASGASGVSSHGNPETYTGPEHGEQDFDGQLERNTRRNPIPQYGLRNTVDIGQHQHDMENLDKMNRGQRSASAPPENRQQQTAHQYGPLYNPAQQQFQPQQSEQQQPQNTNQRFVSRVDITPQHQLPSEASEPLLSPKNQQQMSGPRQQSPPQQPQQQRSQQKPPQQSGNVRHIPIFVEGRDEPVIPKNVDEAAFPPPSHHQPQSLPQFQSSSQFHRPSTFNQHFNNRQQQWPPHFHEPEYTQHTQTQQPQRPNHYQQQQQQYRQQQAEKQHEQQQQQQQERQTESPKLKQIQPKDPLEKVAAVQNEVDSLMEQVKLFSGNSRQAKDYMYLDEMLTRELIKLDDIETEGKENVRQARKDTIKSIQNCIALLESKVPIPGHEQTNLANEGNKSSQEIKTTDIATEVHDPETPQSQNAVPIPLPPAHPASLDSSRSSTETTVLVPSTTLVPTPITTSSSFSETSCAPIPGQESLSEKQTSAEESAMPIKPDGNDESMGPESPAFVKASSATAMDIQDSGASFKSHSETTDAEKISELGTTATNHDESMDVDNAKVARSPKKSRKTKPPKPVSEEPIPLPAPSVGKGNIN